MEDSIATHSGHYQAGRGQTALTGKILARFEERGFKLIALKIVSVSSDLAEAHYAVHKGKFFYQGLVDYITSSPVVVMVLEGHEAIGAVRKMVGATRPWEAEAGTIRGDLALMGLRNLIHASDAPETAASGIACGSKPEELFSMRQSRQVGE